MKANTRGLTLSLEAPRHPLNLKPRETDPYTRGRDKVAILGTGSGKTHAPWNYPEWEIWALNNMDVRTPGGPGGEADEPRLTRVDRWFELHPRAVADDDRAVLECPASICYVVDAEEWPESERAGQTLADCQITTFPCGYAFKEGRRYFASTFSWEVAFALALGYKEIGLWGVQLLSGREGIVERASLAYWLGVAEGRGVKVTIPPECYVLWHPALYGIDYWKELEYVGQHVRRVKPTLRTTPERPPCPRPQESYLLEREADEAYGPFKRWWEFWK